MSKIKLFCIPHAGGSAASYSKWQNYINPSIEICPIELAGRGKRFKEEPYNNIGEAVEDIYNIIKKDLDREYAFFGHSMGSLIAYELTHYIMQLENKPPEHIFFSGRKAPNVIYENNSIHKLSEENLKNKLLEFSGTPKEVLDNEHMCKVFLKILRQDFKICELYTYKNEYPKLNCNITILNGNRDDIKINHIAFWKQHTSKACYIYFFKGGHFYIDDNMENLASIINSTLGIFK
ncbi:thioesterase II family protein [Clostridium pasteurianum]|uniref:Putative thioesterase involved in non-ribosomal peptide biosynthesis n=1 Tax=Clostridium pasteurianum BC1 TaxID=86416 RepID=R4K6Z0_CLOPA|nr:thioesterase domain-containing protein [Clostridium pasteurianum]AGK96289.1 putative thioesterase involved in non-ribosomal peptide biosynthesis [Clostridium pasteurianum BC1]